MGTSGDQPGASLRTIPIPLQKRIARVLREAGWQEADIGRALDAFAELEFPLPVPKPQPYLSAREVFTYLVLFAARIGAAAVQ